MNAYKPDKLTIGLTEEILLYGQTVKKVKARIDTGATKSSIDEKLAEELGLGPAIGKSVIKSASGQTTRPVIRAEVRVHGKKLIADFTTIDRNHMKYKVLIGQNILLRGFLIDPNKKPEEDKK